MKDEVIPRLREQGFVSESIAYALHHVTQDSSAILADYLAEVLTMAADDEDMESREEIDVLRSVDVNERKRAFVTQVGNVMNGE
jgi:hypothetical protein